MTQTLKVLGINDEVTTCECCGKSNLKKTVVLGTDSGEVHYGVNCAAMALRGGQKAGDRKAVETEANAVGLAKRWLTAGHPAEVVRKGIWNRFGFLTEIKGGELLIGTFAAIKVA